ncbi:putative nucleosome-remodeling factor subunit BPTF [Monocercomonoides exilis]|uniref:putative nucleosome-remodeling factor subunit BPTF n=1 Tax=Monocercomonoides exilis TaxID=2049356 RepID=UPI0035594DA7|nr:putative nucleosome-remodeling factor subunit BPTF [Monocercomonoides exilis]|eukprot:MONOS_12971.1-p1 / transcript=MONOS_12971.1 / gene=MONOS_12971 / organism=Monocercomonoides_exilis_PA203 / gene_product=unspecified product / transcript_product=unspecified product / location=Mono_scaffold00761:17550-18884(-) / protein_length=221 / sequence_SO=supercontig / SO=protein_coding / is_pseudo=false
MLGNHRKKGSDNDPSRLYCICRTPFIEGQFMIQCDKCKEWYHGVCVSITPKQAESMDVYICDACLGKSLQGKKRIAGQFLQEQPAQPKPQKDIRADVIRHLEAILKRGSEKCVNVLTQELSLSISNEEKEQKMDQIKQLNAFIMDERKIHSMAVEAERGLKETYGGEKEKKYRDQYKNIKNRMDSEDPAVTPWKLRFLLGETPAFDLGAVEIINAAAVDAF